DVGADGRKDIDARQVARGFLEAAFHRIAIDDQNLAVPPVLAERRGKSLGLRVAQFQRVDDHEAIPRLRGKRHLQTERTDLLVERLLELTTACAVSLAATDEDRRTTIAVASRAAALLAPPLLARASNIGTFAGRAGDAATVLELPGDDTMQDVGTRLHAEHGVIELDVASRFAAEFLDLHLHGSALLRFIGRWRVAFGAVGFPGGRGIVGSSTCLLFLQQLFLLLRRHFGSDLMLGSRLDHAGGSLFTLGSRALLLQDRARERRTLRKRQLHSVAYEQPRI